MSKILTVFGATGNQGGSVIKHVQAHPQLSKEFKLRAVTRDVNQESAKALSAQGIEVVSGDLMDKESLMKAVEGSYAVFAVTGIFGVSGHWEPDFKYKDTIQGKNIADVCAALGVQHLIWSTLPDATKESDGALTNIIHFDSKAEVKRHIQELGIPATFFTAGFFMQNFDTMFQKEEDGSYTIVWPNPPEDKNFPIFDAAGDTGLFVASILLKRSEMLGKDIFGATAFYSPNDVISIFQKATGKKAKYVEVPAEVWRGYLPPSMAEALVENFAFTRDYKYFGKNAVKDLEESLRVTEGTPTSLEQYFERKKALW